MGLASELAMEEVIVELMGAMLGAWALGLLISLALYVLQALGLYTIAERRKIRRPWLAWIPVADMYLIGCISDQFQQVARLQKTRRRGILLALSIVNALSNVGSVIMAVTLIGQLVSLAPQIMNGMDLDAFRSQLEVPMMQASSASSALSLVSLLFTIFRYIALYDIYASCVPENKTMFLVLSIFFGFLPPILIFANRNRDDGMQAPKPVSFDGVWQRPQTAPAQPQEEPQPETPAAPELPEGVFAEDQHDAPADAGEQAGE